MKKFFLLPTWRSEEVGTQEGCQDMTVGNAVGAARVVFVLKNAIGTLQNM